MLYATSQFAALTGVTAKALLPLRAARSARAAAHARRLPPLHLPRSAAARAGARAQVARVCRCEQIATAARTTNRGFRGVMAPSSANSLDERRRADRSRRARHRRHRPGRSTAARRSIASSPSRRWDRWEAKRPRRGVTRFAACSRPIASSPSRVALFQKIRCGSSTAKSTRGRHRAQAGRASGTRCSNARRAATKGWRTSETACGGKWPAALGCRHAPL